MSAQKALQGSETETRELLGRTEENSVSLMRGTLLAKRKQKKIELVARPVVDFLFSLWVHAHVEGGG